MHWEKVYFKKATTEGERPFVYPVMETIKDFRLYCADVPFLSGGEAKELPQNDWGDEDGVEEYMPEGGIPLKSYNITLTFYIKGNPEHCKYNIDSFRDYLSGRDNTGCVFSMYSEHSHTGVKKVRFVSMDHNPEYVMTRRGMVGKIKVTLKVLDPREEWNM